MRTENQIGKGSLKIYKTFIKISYTQLLFENNILNTSIESESPAHSIVKYSS